MLPNHRKSKTSFDNRFLRHGPSDWRAEKRNKEDRQMPTYDYKCDACGHAFEKFQSITASAIRTCPKCRRRKVRRLIGAGAGIIFKGSGFNHTDYRSDSYRKAAKDDSTNSTSGGTSSDDKSTKPADKPKNTSAKKEH